MKIERKNLVRGFALALVLAACSDAQVSVPGKSSGYRYDLAALSKLSQIQSARLYVMADPFSVQPSLITPHEYTGTYNGCIEIQALFDGERGVLFSFINWTTDEDELIVLLNWSPAKDAAIHLSNDDGGDLEAMLSTTSEGDVPRKFSLAGGSPRLDTSGFCLEQANAG